MSQTLAYDKAAAAVRTLGVDSTDLGGKLRGLSNELNTNFSTAELMAAAYDVASSGFASAAQATDVLRASALGATGGFSDLNTVADATTSVLNAYGLSSASAGRIVDGFIQTQNDGKIIVGQYAAQIGRVAPIAAAAGVGIEDLNAAISAVTAQGLPVESTFSGIRQALSGVLKPSEQAKDLAKLLGLEFNAQALQAKGLGGFLEDVARKTKGAADTNAILFGSVEAQAAIQPLLNDELRKYNEFRGKQVNVEGEAAKAADIASKTIAGSFKRMQNSFSNLVTTQSGITGFFAGIINQVSDLVDLFGKLSTAQERWAARGRAADIIKNVSGPLQRLTGEVAFTLNGKEYKGGLSEVGDALTRDILAAGSKSTIPITPGATPPKAAGDLLAAAQAQKEAAEAAAKAAKDIREASQKLRNDAITAAGALKDAIRGRDSNRVSQFDILTDSARADLRNSLNSRINASITAQGIDPARAAAQFGAGFSRAGSFSLNGRTIGFGGGGLDTSNLSVSQLQEFANATESVADSNRQLIDAQAANTAATNALETAIRKGTYVAVSLPEGSTADSNLPVRYQ